MSPNGHKGEDHDVEGDEDEDKSRLFSHALRHKAITQGKE